MVRMWTVAALALVGTSASAPAFACMAPAPFVFEDAKWADVVVVGHITNLRFILNQKERLEVLSIPDLKPRVRQAFRDPARIASDFAIFDFVVDKHLTGTSSSKISISTQIYNVGRTTLTEKESFLVAFNRITAGRPSLDTVDTMSQPSGVGSLKIFKPSCAEPFVFPSMSNEAGEIRRIFGASAR